MSADPEPPLVLAEFGTPEALLEAARRLRDGGHELEDAYTPCPVEGLEEVLELERTRIPWLVLAAAFGAAGLAYLLQWWITAVDYPLNVGGRPLHPAPAFVPITFEMAVLFGAIAGFAAFFLAGGMPKLWDPLFEIEGFHRASVDRYWLAVVDRGGEDPGSREPVEHADLGEPEDGEAGPAANGSGGEPPGGRSERRESLERTLESLGALRVVRPGGSRGGGDTGEAPARETPR